MDILHVCANTTGGGETYFSNFLKYMDNYVLVELLNENSAIKKNFPNKYISLGSQSGLINKLRSFTRYVQFVNQTKPEIINAQDHISLIFTLFLSYLPLIHKPKTYYYTKHGLKARKYAIYDTLQQMYFNHCAAVFCVSDTACESMMKYHIAKFIRIYNGLDLEDYANSLVPVKPRTITSFGRLVHEKGIDLLLSAFNTAKNTKNYMLLIFGPTDDNSVLQLINTSKNTSYLGILDKKETMRKLQESEIIVIPSRVEGFGYTALEALCTRDKPKTLIVSDIGAFKEILGSLPTYFRSGDADDLAAKLDYVICNNAKFKINPKTKKRVIGKFSAKKMIGAYLEVYNPTGS